jgi:hypothetical protein
MNNGEIFNYDLTPEEKHSIAMEEIKRRLLIVREALFCARMDIMLRDGNVTKDTQAQVNRAFELLS